MLGYRIYFNGDKFVADEVATDVQTITCDSTTCWMHDPHSAEALAELYNIKDLQNVRRCKKCGEYFWQTDEERRWFTDRKLKEPCRCYSCRKRKWKLKEAK